MQFKTLFFITFASVILADDPAAATIKQLDQSIGDLGRLGTNFDGSLGAVTNILNTGRKIVGTLATAQFIPDSTPSSPEVQQERFAAAQGLATTVGSVAQIGVAFQAKLVGLLLQPSRPVLKTVIQTGRVGLNDIGTKYLAVINPEQQPAVKNQFDMLNAAMDNLIASFN